LYIVVFKLGDICLEDVVSGWELHRIAKETASGGMHDVGSSQQTSGKAKKQ